jgi:hypothetical protein
VRLLDWLARMPTLFSRRKRAAHRSAEKPTRNQAPNSSMPIKFNGRRHRAGR